MRRRQARPGLVGTMARAAVITGTASAVSGSVAQRQQARAQAGAQPPAPVASEQPPPTSATPPAAAPPATEPTIAELERLAALKQQGLLTDDEFAALKARLLAP